jgi:hypothetical protein
MEDLQKCLGRAFTGLRLLKEDGLPTAWKAAFSTGLFVSEYFSYADDGSGSRGRSPACREVVGKVSELRVLVVLSIGTLQSRQVVLHRFVAARREGAVHGVHYFKQRLLLINSCLLRLLNCH